MNLIKNLFLLYMMIVLLYHNQLSLFHLMNYMVILFLESHSNFLLSFQNRNIHIILHQINPLIHLFFLFFFFLLELILFFVDFLYFLYFYLYLSYFHLHLHLIHHFHLSLSLMIKNYFHFENFDIFEIYFFQHHLNFDF